MRVRRISILLLISTLLLGFNLPTLVAKENPKGNAKDKSKETPAVISKNGTSASTPGSSADNPQVSKKDSSASTTPTSQSVDTKSDSKPSKTDEKAPKSDDVKSKQIDSSGKVDKAENSVKIEKPAVPEKSAGKLQADSVVDLGGSPSESCKAAAKAKKKVAQNLCYDFIVVFKPDLARGNSDKLLSDAGAERIREFKNIFNGALVNGPLAKMQALAKNPNVLVVEDDLEVKTAAVQSPAPWGLDRVDQSTLPLSQSFDDRDVAGLNSYSYVVDTGIDSSNGDFEGRLSGGFTAVLDGRGSLDCNGHGTHVAGTIGGKTYGVAKKTTLVPVRVLDCAGSGTYSSVISGLDWIAANHPAGVPAVVNMSLGGPASSTLDGAVRNLIAKGITVVVAAGNSAADACNYSPARVMEAITVAATTITDVRASYSNFGSCVDIFAPGSEITSNWLGNSATNTISGTSMATPHVAGAVVRFVTSNSTLTPGQIANSLTTNATSGVVVSPGTGSPNKLLFIHITPDTTTAVPVDSSPTFKKTTPRGKKR